jgi:hypothetical protein
VAAGALSSTVNGERLVAAPVVLLVSLAGLYREYRSQQRRRSLAAVGALWPTPRARLHAHSIIIGSSGKLRLEHVELAQNPGLDANQPEALVRCEGSLSLEGCLVSRTLNDGIECVGGRVELKESALHNCGGSGLVLSAGSCAVDRCSFASNRRFGCEARGGDSLVVDR